MAGVGLGRGYANQDCSLARALEVVGERWTLLVLRDCFYGVRRFSDLQTHLDLPKAVLAERLKTLVAVGVLERNAPATGLEYVLTERGLTLWPAVFALAQWGEAQFAPDGSRRLFSHAGCGQDLAPTGWCEHCRELPLPADLVIRQGPGANPDLRSDRVSRALRAQPHRLLTPLFPEPSSQALPRVRERA